MLNIYSEEKLFRLAILFEAASSLVFEVPASKEVFKVKNNGIVMCSKK